MTSPVSNPSSPYDVNLYIKKLEEEKPKKLRRNDAKEDLMMLIFRVALDRGVQENEWK